MAISDIQKRTQPDALWRTCLVCDTLENLPGTDKLALVALLADPQLRYSTLADELAKEGIDIPPNTLSRHARGQCGARVKLR